LSGPESTALDRGVNRPASDPSALDLENASRTLRADAAAVL
jgi:hypothetical protein